MDINEIHDLKEKLERYKKENTIINSLKENIIITTNITKW